MEQGGFSPSENLARLYLLVKPAASLEAVGHLSHQAFTRGEKKGEKKFKEEQEMIESIDVL